MAVELEVMERACGIWDQPRTDRLAPNLADQSHALTMGDAARFHTLDYAFHKLICDMSGLPMAFETIERCKRNVDRLCVLSLSNDERITDVLDDHRALADALSRRSIEDARAQQFPKYIRHIRITSSEQGVWVSTPKAQKG
jgi:DNA-binding GntR family transcriptional regulator